MRSFLSFKSSDCREWDTFLGSLFLNLNIVIGSNGDEESSSHFEKETEESKEPKSLKKLVESSKVRFSLLLIEFPNEKHYMILQLEVVDFLNTAHFLD